MTDCRSHPPHLPVHPLTQGELQPDRGDLFPKSNRNRPVGQVRRLCQKAGLCGPRERSAENYTGLEALQRRRIGEMLHLYEVDFWK